MGVTVGVFRGGRLWSAESASRETYAPVPFLPLCLPRLATHPQAWILGASVGPLVGGPGRVQSPPRVRVGAGVQRECTRPRLEQDH